MVRDKVGLVTAPSAELNVTFTFAPIGLLYEAYFKLQECSYQTLRIQMGGFIRSKGKRETEKGALMELYFNSAPS